MKVYYLTFILSLLCLVEKSNSGVIDSVYGTVEHGTQTVRDSVNSWWSYGKDVLFGSNSETKVNENTVNGTVAKTDQGILGGAYNRIVNGYRTARQKLHDFFVKEKADNAENKDSVKPNGIYERVSKRVSQLKSFVFGSNDNATNSTNDIQNITDIRKSVYDFLKEQTIKKNGNNFNTIHNKVKEGVDTTTESFFKLRQDAENHISDGVSNIKESLADNVNTAKEKLGTTVDDLLQNANDLTDREKEFLNSITNKLRSRVTNIYETLQNATNDIKQLSYSAAT